MADIKCFLIQKTGFTHRYLRRYVSSFDEKLKCPLPGGYHNAEFFVDKGLIGEPSNKVSWQLDKTDPRWPKQCGCGYFFPPGDDWQLFVQPEYARADDVSVVYTLNKVPVGAIWRAEWYEDSMHWVGADGKCYVVRTPGGDWVIDSRASNCTMPDDNTHKCWVRHGEAPDFTVDKNGNTCAAGAGSIAMRDYHGFLRNGYLTNA